MKKSIYILTLIIMSLLSLGVTVQAQILESTESLRLSIYPSDLIVRGSFNIKTDNPLKDYFININGVIRIGDNSIKLKKKDHLQAKIRIEVNKGILNLGGKTKLKNKHNYKRIESVSEGKLDNPIDIDSWSVNRLSIEDKDITISIYDNNTGQLLEEKKYELKPDSVFGCPYPKLCYTNLAGKEVKVESLKLKVDDDIDYSKPMKIVVENIWDRSYKVCSYNVKDFHSMCGWSSDTTNGDTLDKDIIRKLPKGYTIFITDIIIEKEGIRRLMSPIEIRK